MAVAGGEVGVVATGVDAEVIVPSTDTVRRAKRMLLSRWARHSLISIP